MPQKSNYGNFGKYISIRRSNEAIFVFSCVQSTFGRTKAIQCKWAITGATKRSTKSSKAQKNKNNRSSYEQQMLKSVSNRMRVAALVYLSLRDLCLVCVPRIFIHGI